MGSFPDIGFRGGNVGFTHDIVASAALKSFRSSPQKDFCNNIPMITDIVSEIEHVRFVPVAEVRR
jgi:hypothetical protein